MKFLKSSVLLLLAVLAFGVTSCSDKAPGVQSLLPADADVLVALNLSRTFENADCKANANGITLSPTVKKVLEESGADESMLNDIANMRGIDFENIYVVVTDAYGNQTKAALLTEVQDMNALTESLSSLGLENQMVDDYMVYDADASILIRDNVLWISDKNPTKAIEYVANIKSQASKKSVATVQWLSSYLSADRCMTTLVNFANMPENLKKQIGNPTVGAATLTKLMEGRMAMTLDFDGLEAIWKVNGIDENGKAIDLTAEMGDIKATTINPEFLEYLSADDIFLVAYSIPENYPWNDLLKAVAATAGIPAVQLQMVSSYLEDLQGTVAIACGPTNGVTSFNLNNASSHLDWDGVICITLKPGKADEYFDQLSQLASSAGEVTMNKADKSLSVNAGIATVHMAVRGDMLVFATHAIEKSGASVFSKSDLTDQYTTFIAKISKDNKLAEDLNMPFGVFMRAFANDNTGILTTELTGCQGLFLSNVIEYIAQQSQK